MKLSSSLSGVVPQALARVKRLFDLACDPQEIVAVLGPLADAHPGVRVPGAFDGFEVAVRAVLGQQVTVKAARTLAGRFAARFGTPVETPYAALSVAFPGAKLIEQAEPEEIATLGVLRSRVRSIQAIAARVASGALTLDATVDVAAELERLRALPGIGEWTAQYLAKEWGCRPSQAIARADQENAELQAKYKIPVD